MTIANNKISRGNLVWIAVLVILMLVGLAAWVYQLNVGLHATGMNNVVSWGLYIITFAFLVGLSAGGLIVASAAYVFDNERLQRMAPLGVVVAVASVLGAMAIIIPDVGRPERLGKLLLNANIASPIVWDFVILFTYLLVGLFEGWVLFGKRWRQAPSTRRTRLIRITAYVALPVAVLVHSVTAWIFGIQVGRPFWFTGLMAPIFLSSALVSGLGLLLLVMLLSRRMGIVDIDDDTFSYLGGMLAAFIALDFFLLICELLAVSYARGIAEFEGVTRLLIGSLAPLFWAAVILGALVPFVILVYRRSPFWIGLAAFLAMTAVFVKRINVILPGFQSLNIDYAPGVSSGRYTAGLSPFMKIPTYTPTFPEILITVGALSLVAFLITVGVGVFISRSEREQHLAEPV